MSPDTIPIAILVWNKYDPKLFHCPHQHGHLEQCRGIPKMQRVYYSSFSLMHISCLGSLQNGPDLYLLSGSTAVSVLSVHCSKIHGTIHYGTLCTINYLCQYLVFHLHLHFQLDSFSPLEEAADHK